KLRLSELLERNRSVEISKRLPCDPERSEAQWAGRCAWHRAVSPHGESPMLPNLAAEIAALPRLRVSELRIKFAEVFGEPTQSHNKVWLVKRIAWRLPVARTQQRTNSTGVFTRWR